MNWSSTLEQSTFQSDILTITPIIRVDPVLLSVLTMLGINANDAAAYFVEIFNKVKFCQPNYRYFNSVKDNIWVLRDFYSDTPIMFKMTVVIQTPLQQCERYRQIWNYSVSESDFNALLFVNVKLVTHNFRQKRISVSYSQAQQYSMAKAANILIDDTIQPKPFLNLEQKKLRRMFPKGYQNSSKKK